ncbi:MAG: penicillin-binding protein 1C [Methylocystaceae bacterium]|nr:penicillin-binding protein 1C [Methylocystaceae bacterium]
MVPVSIRLWWITAASLVAFLFAGAWILNFSFPPNLNRLSNVSVVVEGEKGDILRVFSTAEGLLRLEGKAQDVDKKYLQFLKLYEDKRFDQHYGIDPLALMRAIGQWLRAGYIVSGGSTITMQVARLLEPRPRTIRSKVIEILRAVQLEWYFSKQEILDMYVTLAPYGGRLEGVRGASLSYFQKSPKNLTIAEAALLTAIPQSPSRNRPDRYPARAKQVRQKILKRLLERGAISHEEFKEADNEPIPTRQHAIPMLAPHLSERLARVQPDKHTIKTTINEGLQKQVQDLISPYSQKIGRNISAAVLVVDNESGAVKVHVGSKDYLERRSLGFIDMTTALRSPGSTLKPFIYALSFEDKQTHPQTLIWDRAPTENAYRPTNFDGQERGQVTIADALRYSLNVPAVKVLGALGPIRFSETLKSHGFDMILPGNSSKPNLAIALGGVGVSLEELVKVYRAVASDRKICSLSFVNQPLDCKTETEFISAQTQDWIQGILQNVPRPDGYTYRENVEQNKIGFKTGTSYGYRDAWAIGFNQEYTVGVWIGDPRGAPVAGQTGLQTAAPLMFSVFEKLSLGSNEFADGRKRAWKEAPPENLRIFRGDISQSRISHASNSLQISYPINDTAFLLSDVETKGVLLKAENGKRPLIWFVNDVPLNTNKWKRQVRWFPTGNGFYDIAVLDQNGEVNRKSVQIR